MKFNYKKPYPKDNNFWWIEFGGNLNTIFDANDIQYELKRIAYGVWEYMKTTLTAVARTTTSTGSARFRASVSPPATSALTS